MARIARGGDVVSSLVETLLADTADAVITLDAAGIIRFASPGASALFGYDAASSIGSSVFSYLHRDDVEAAAELFAQRLRYQGADLGHIMRIRSARGDWLEVEATARLLPPSTLGVAAITIRSTSNGSQRVAALRRRVIVDGYCMRLGSELLDASTPTALIARVEQALSEMGLLTGADIVAVYVANEAQDGKIKLQRSCRWTRPSYADVAGIEHLGLDFGPAQVERLLGERRVINDLEAEWGRSIQVSPSAHIVAVNSAPFAAGNEKGMIVFMRCEPGPDWLDADVRLARNAAHQIGSALHKARTDELVARTFHEGPIGFSIRSWDGEFVDCNQQFLNLQGISRTEAEDQNLRDILHPDEQDEMAAQLTRLHRGDVTRVSHDCRIILPDLAVRWVRVNAVRLDGATWSEPMVLMSLEDVTESHAKRVRLEHSARHDSLTGVANRDALLERIDTFVAENDRLPNMLIIDVDRFKLVNDSLGHHAGDQVLSEISRRLVAHAGALDLVARIGGDEFAVLVNSPNKDRAVALAETLRRSMQQPLEIDGRSSTQTISIGVALGDTCANTAELMVHADRAMYAAKAQGRNQHVLFNASMRDEAMSRTAMEDDLRRAAEQGQIEVHFQPEFALGTRKVIGAEALIRWRHPRLGLLPASYFVEVAERSGLIDQIGAAALHQACRSFSAIVSEAYDEELVLRINISAREFARPELVEVLQSALTTSGLAPHRLCLEMSENTLMDSPDVALDTFRRLGKTGVRFAVDNFGTGYSSLHYLEQFPIDAVKIDSQFVQRVNQGPKSRMVVDSIIGMSRALDLDVIAEGVESEDQLSILIDLGCTRAQGHLVSEALDPNAFLAFMYA